MPTLEITTMMGCPLKCAFCPQDLLRAKYGKQEKYLSLDNFKLVLSKVPKYVRIDFSGMAEPWANPDATAMLLHSLDQGYRIAIYTTLYGMETPDVPVVVDALLRHARQVEVICVHLPDAGGNMRGFRPSPAYAQALGAFLKLKSTGVFRDFHFMTMNGAGEVHPDLRDVVSVPGGWIANTRAGTVTAPEGAQKSIETVPCHSSPVTCSYTPFFDQNVMLPNGDVLLCCMDYSTKHRLGNLIEDDYFSIFSSEGMGALRRENTKFGASESICRSCTRATAYGLTADSHLIWRPRAYDESKFRKVAALHPSWRGVLLLSKVDNVVIHEGHQTKGVYTVDGRVLKVDWADFPPEQFVEIEDVYVHVGLVGQMQAEAPKQALAS